MGSESHQNPSFGFPRFILFFEISCVFFVDEFWGRRKVGRKSQRTATSADNLIPMGSFGAGEAGCRGGERGGIIENC